MTAPLSLSERLAQAKSSQQAQTNAKSSVEAVVANQQASAEAVTTADRVFYGELPIAVSYLTNSGKVVHFYEGYCVTDDSEVAEYCEKLKEVREVTGEVKLEDVPRPPMRSRMRNWAGTAEKTVMTPGELLARAVRVQSTAELPQAAASNSGIPAQ